MGHEFQSSLRRWDVIANLCKQIDAKSYIEVGCKEGRTTGFVLDKCPSIRAVAIDPWCKQAPSSDVSRETYENWDFSAIEAEFKKNVGDNADRCMMIRATSAEAAAASRALLVDDRADIIFIDAAHDYSSVLEDIDRWWPKVKPGGFLVMHDFNHKWPGVQRAISERFNLFDVNLGPDSVAYVQKRRPQ